MYRVYGDRYSGNCYKVQLLLAWLELPHAWVAVDILAGETRTEAFLARNPAGQIPVLELPDGQWLPESNAILHYLAEGTPFLPSDRLARARVLQWQCFEQYSHEPHIATARFIRRYLGMPPEREAECREKLVAGYRALKVMEGHLANHRFFVGDRPTIADISLYAYTHVADEGGFSLDGFPRVRRWLADVAALPGHVPMGEPAG